MSLPDNRWYGLDAGKEACVYILASRRNGTLCVGVTSQLMERVALHKQNYFSGFTSRYRVHMLVYVEVHHSMDEAIAREKQLKRWKRRWKLSLIERDNPSWRDLFQDFV